MFSGAEREVSTNSVRRAPVSSGGQCPAPASVIRRSAGSQYPNRAVAERAGSVSRSSSSRSDRTATGSSPSITAYARREARSRPIAATAPGPDPVTEPTLRPSAASGSASASYQSPPPRGPVRCRTAIRTPDTRGSRDGSSSSARAAMHARVRSVSSSRARCSAA
ncbi:hypothetical protein SFUMM280S_00589 [Streptomyces fumanus]